MLRTFSQNKIYARPSQARRRTRSSSSSLQGFGRHETLPLLLRQAEHRSSAFLSKKADLDRSGNKSQTKKPRESATLISKQSQHRKPNVLDQE